MFSLSVTAQTITIPDPNFKSFLVTHYDTSGDGEIQVSEAEAVTGTMDTPGEYGSPGNITDLTGIEYFTGITELDCCHEQLTALDVSANTALTYLNCGDNQLTALDVSANAALQVLYCYSNQLTALDVSANTALTYLNCRDNQLATLDVSANTALTYLYCDDNQLTALDVSANTALQDLQCNSNQLTVLDVSANTALQTLWCAGNQLTDIPDVTGCTGLNTYYCGGNYFNADDCATITDISSMGIFSFYYNPQADGYILDCSGSTTTHTITCSAGTGGSTNPTGAQEVYDGSSQIVHMIPDTGYVVQDVIVDGASVGPVSSYTFTNISGNHTIDAYFGTDYAITIPDPNFKAFLVANYDTSGDGEIQVSEARAVTGTMDTPGYMVRPGNISYLTGIEYFIHITGLDCSFEQLTALDVSANTALTYLNCGGNQLTALDVSANTALQYLDCRGYQLTALDVSANTALTYLDCAFNHLAVLDVSANTELTYLDCSSNHLTDIPDVAFCTSLNDYRCYSNYFNADDCATIAAIEAMGLSTFAYNPQADGYTLDCSAGTATHTITCSAGTGGSTNPAGNQEVYDGSSQIVHIIPDTGYAVLDVLVDGSSVGAVISYIFSNITADHTIEATFIKKALNDFSNDGKSDILWHNTGDGGNLIWEMDGATVSTSNSLAGIADTNWDIVGKGDFDADGNLDILWRNNSTGANIIWFMNGISLDHTGNVTPVSNLEWAVRETADFNGDGKADILWRRTTGNGVILWLMDGATLVQNKQLPGIPSSDWDVHGTGDFDGDGDLDILWRNSGNGGNIIWFMNGSSLGSVANTTPVANLEWAIRGTEDFSGDGKADILWRRTTGNGVILWIMDGATLVQNKQLPGIPSSDWDVSQVGDYNGDSHLDILWRNSGTGGNLIWFMNGAGLGSVANTTAVSPTSGWAIR